MILKKMNYFSLGYAKEPAVPEGNQIIEERKFLFSDVF